MLHKKHIVRNIIFHCKRIAYIDNPCSHFCVSKIVFSLQIYESKRLLLLLHYFVYHIGVIYRIVNNNMKKCTICYFKLAS